MMKKRTDVFDSVWCLLFGASSIGGWLWFCWHLSFRG
jgi:hypothetical protein